MSLTSWPINPWSRISNLRPATYALADCPEARSVSVHDRRKPVYGQRLPWVTGNPTGISFVLIPLWLGRDPGPG